MNNKNSSPSKTRSGRTTKAPRESAYSCALPRHRISLTQYNLPSHRASISASVARFAQPRAERKPLPHKFLIAIPLLESPVTRTKISPLTFSNRDSITVFQLLPKRRLCGFLTHGRAFRTAGIQPAPLPFPPLATSHSSLITAFLIYGPAIRIPRKPQKT